jgi:dTDP-L-rhamnose 4-epimerase
MRVLLTGAAGFIGGAIRRELEAGGHDVVPVDVLLAQAHRVTPALDGLHRLDVREAADWAELLDGVDVVCHQAALVGAGTTVADLPAYAAHNDLGTAALLAAMSARDVRRLVLASSMVVYGEGRYACPSHGDVAPPPRSISAMGAGDFDNHCNVCGQVLGWELVEESARLDPRSSYAAGKVAQEHYTSAWARQDDAAAIALRYHNVYGPGMPRNTPYSGVAAIFRSSLERGEAPQVFEDGAQMRDFVHVGDVARANVVAIGAVARMEPGSMAAYNVCSGSPVSILDVARILVGASGGPDRDPLVTGRYRPGDVRHVVASPALAAKDLGFTAAVAPAEGLAEFAHAPLRE